MIDEHQNKYNCPHCGCILDTSTGFDPTKVKHDDFTICAECAGVCNYIVEDGKYSLRKATDKDIDIAKQTGLYGQMEELIDFVKSKNSRIIRPSS